MKIACIGNMNNALFCLTRYLRDRGYDAHLLSLEGEPEHFSPEADSYNDQYKSYTQKLIWSKKPSIFYHTSKQQILSDISGFDFFIACDISIAYLAKAGIKTDIFIPYGSDIHITPNLKVFEYPWKKWHKIYALKYYQRKAINNARVISLETSNPDFEKQFVEPLKIDHKRIFTTCPFIYYPQYENGEMEEYAPKSPLYGKFRKIREMHDIVVFHHSRQEWRADGKMEVQKNVWTKGNDILIRGFAEFVINNPSVKSALIMFEYGTQVESSKNLVKELDISGNVFWFPKSYRKDIMLGIQQSDLGVGELGLSWYTYGTILEYMALGVPVVHKRDDTLYAAAGKELYSMIHAQSPYEIYAALECAKNEPKKFMQIGAIANEWFKKNLIEKPLNQYTDLIGPK